MVMMELRSSLVALAVLCVWLARSPALGQSATAAAGAKCAKFGNSFDVSLESTNVDLACQVPGSPSRRNAVCCEAVSNSTAVAAQRVVRPAQCTEERVYVPSEFELYNLRVAREIDSIESFDDRLKALLDFTTSADTIRNSTRWLARVQEHMRTPSDAERGEGDQLLSRFVVTRTCGDKGPITWEELIEPITVTARHPFAFGRCRNAQTHMGKGVPRVGRSDVNYVLLQPRPPSGRARRSSSRRSFLFDAGTSTFDSSLFWFTCGYQQRGTTFDQVYGWEMTLLEPRDYWARVPAKFKPFWHFYNTPISADPDHADSPVRFIKALATREDFVSFKLDIDHPDTEMPIALSLLSDPALRRLVDEFFFELHFQCEVMTSCGWGKRVPESAHGLRLRRAEVLDFFLRLRRSGVRAHIWP